MTAPIEVTHDEIAEKIDELADLCKYWTMNRARGLEPRSTRAAIVMTAQDISALVRVQEAGEVSAKPRAWLVSKADMHGNLYDALAWDNGGKPLGVSVNTPVPMYDDAAIREMIVAIQGYREAIRRALEAWDTTTNSKSHDGRLWQCMEELRMEIER